MKPGRVAFMWRDGNEDCRINGQTVRPTVIHAQGAQDGFHAAGVKDISASTPATNIADPEGGGYTALEKTIRQTWGNDLIVSPFFVIGGSDSKHFQARPFAPDVYTITGIQLESIEEFAGFHGVNERIRVDEYGRTIGCFYKLMENLEDLWKTTPRYAWHRQAYRHWHEVCNASACGLNPSKPAYRPSTFR